MTRPARVLVNISALKANFEVVRSLAPRSRVMAIVKADGYGHGTARIASALQSQADAYGVACIEEALRLRDAGVRSPIVLLEGLFSAAEVDTVVAKQLETVVHSPEQIAPLEKSDHPIPVWLKVDSGMHRLGFAPSAIDEVVARLQRPDRSIRFLTHLANVQQSDDGSVAEQLQVFNKALSKHEGERSIANSGAILSTPSSHTHWVRPGIMLYGVSPFAGLRGRDHGLVPAMTLSSRLIAVREVEAGGGVGYGRGFVCPERMRVGVVAFGYGDGYPRQAGTGTPILVKGTRTQVVGFASMDMLTVDLRPIPDAQVGDPVVLWGPDLPVEEIAETVQTIPYELLCRVRMRARYVECGQ